MNAQIDGAALVAAHDWGERTPFEVQAKTMATMVENHRAYVLNGLGTGKTFCTLGAFHILLTQGLAHRMLVVAPLSTLRFVWHREIIACFPTLRVVILHGTREKRLQLLEKDADIYIINHDGVATIFDELLWRVDIDVLALDELATYRNGGAKRTRMMRQIAARKKYGWGLTGSPMPKDVTDIWGQCSILTPHTVPKYFNHCRMMLCYKAGPFEWKARDGAVETAVAMMKPSVRYSLDDVIELPEQIFSYVPTDMGRRQTEIYNAMRRKSVALVDENRIDALNAGAVLSKLLQIALGWVYTRDGQTVALDNAARIQAIIDNVEAAANKVLIFLPFKSALEGIGKAMEKAGQSFELVSGDTPYAERGKIFARFQDEEYPRSLLAHPACMAHGVTMTAADTIIWGGPVTSLEIFMQACGRIRRIGQRKKQYIIMLGGTAVEKRMYSLLASNEGVQNHFLSLLADASAAV